MGEQPCLIIVPHGAVLCGWCRGQGWFYEQSTIIQYRCHACRERGWVWPA